MTHALRPPTPTSGSSITAKQDRLGQRSGVSLGTRYWNASALHLAGKSAPGRPLCSRPRMQCERDRLVERQCATLLHACVEGVLVEARPSEDERLLVPLRSPPGSLGAQLPGQRLRGGDEAHGVLRTSVVDQNGGEPAQGKDRLEAILQLVRDAETCGCRERGSGLSLEPSAVFGELCAPRAKQVPWRVRSSCFTRASTRSLRIRQGFVWVPGTEIACCGLALRAAGGPRFVLRL